MADDPRGSAANSDGIVEPRVVLGLLIVVAVALVVTIVVV